MAARLLVSETDFQRLSGLIDSFKQFFRRDQEHVRVLEEELNRAEVVDAKRLPRGVVTMNSRVRVTDLDTGMQTVYTLSFPRDADISDNRLSVLAPLGTAILGYRAGAIVRAHVPGGSKRLKIEEVTTAATPTKAA